MDEKKREWVRGSECVFVRACVRVRQFAAGLTEGHSERNAEAGNELFAPHARKLGH